MPKVFISYSHIDSKVADEITEVLSNQTIEFFRDIKDIEWGDSIDTEVQNGLDDASALLVIISPASLKSQWVPFEIGYAAGKRIKILPFLTHPSLDVPSYIKDLKYLVTINEVQEFFSKGLVGATDEQIQLPNDNSPTKLFSKAFHLMPELFSEMKEDIIGDKTHLIREFVILPSKNVSFNPGKPRFYYFEDEHDNLRNKVSLLEEYGFVQDITPKNSPIYRFKEDFIELLLNIKVED
jgi:hypothetical protein